MRWEPLLNALEKGITPHEGKRILLTAKYIYLNKICIGLLKFFLEKKGMKGIYIAIDRPCHYTARLLEKHDIPLTNLQFLDAITMISSETVKKAPNTEFLESPFCSDLLTDAIETLRKRDKDMAMDFVFLDNLTVMLNYMDSTCLYRFLAQFVVKLSKDGRTATLVVVDKEAHPNVYEKALSECDVEIVIDENSLRA